MTPWLHIVGVGEDGLDGLSGVARDVVDRADLLIGGTRHLSMLPEDARERWTWPSPFDALATQIAAESGRLVCVLASGDPLCFGVARRLAEHFDLQQMRVWPAPSAFALACARLLWPHEMTTQLSLHGRPLETLHLALVPGARVLALSWDERTPMAAAALLIDRGFGASRLTVLERMGGASERTYSAVAFEFAEQFCNTRFDRLNTVAIECVVDRDAPILPLASGLPDTAFVHDGQLTKRSVRAITLAALAPNQGELLWDVGAGCGSIAVEWMRARPRTRALTVERNPKRLEMIANNAIALGVPSLEIVPGTLPAALAGLPEPDAIFIGGAVSNAEVFEHCWRSLRVGGRLVANAVTLEGEAQLLRRYSELGGELQRIAIANARPVGGFTAFTPAMTVTQLALTKV